MELEVEVFCLGALEAALATLSGSTLSDVKERHITCSVKQLSV